MRLISVATALSISCVTNVTLAQSDVTACREVQDSLLRLRCYDDATTPAVPRPAPPTARFLAAPEAPNFDRYPIAPYQGRVTLPDFSGRDREYASFRIRIREGMQNGPNFAGNMSVVEIGCGAGCRFATVMDVRTGAVQRFPLGGESNMYLNLRYRLNSRLLVAQWEDDGRCKQERMIWTGSDFNRSSVLDLGTDDACRAQ